MVSPTHKGVILEEGDAGNGCYTLLQKGHNGLMTPPELKEHLQFVENHTAPTQECMINPRLQLQPFPLLDLFPHLNSGGFPTQPQGPDFVELWFIIKDNFNQDQ